MVALHAGPRSAFGSPDNLSLQSKTGLGLAGSGLIVLVIIIMFPLTGLAGGTITIDNGSVNITIPPGFLSATQTFNFHGTFAQLPQVIVDLNGEGAINIEESQLIFLADANSTQMGMTTAQQVMFPSNNIFTWGCGVCISAGGGAQLFTGGLADANNVTFSMHITSKTGASTGCKFWVQYFDSSSSTWNDLGDTPQTPAVSCQGVGTPSSQSGINSNLHFGACNTFGPTCLLRVVGKTTTGTPVVKINSAEVTEIFPYVAISVSASVVSTSQFTVVIVGAIPGTYSVIYHAYVCTTVPTGC